MWDVQDALRAKEAAQTFDDEFITLAAFAKGERFMRDLIRELAAG